MDKLSKNITFYQKIKKLFFPFYKTKDIKNLFNILEKNKPRNNEVAMLVGGCVRKFLNNDIIDDIDVATIFSPQEIKEKFKESNFKIIDTGIEHGSVTAIINTSKFEITSLRQDIKTDGRHAEILFTDSWKQDSDRRDFTINAIYMNKRGKIYDPQNGREDLKNNKIKFIGNPTSRIEEDYLRIIRYIRFCIQYNIEHSDPNTINAIKLNLTGLKNLSKERILSELYKIFTLKNLNIILNNKEIKNILLLIFPEFKYLERLKKLNKIDNISSLNNEILLAILLIDKKNNHEYFLHKYNVSNHLKDKLNLIFKNYLDFSNNKNFFEKNLKKNIYYFGKAHLQTLNIVYFSINKNVKLEDYLNTSNIIKKSYVPKFPLDGNFLKNKGVREGATIGKILKLLENDWIESNFQISNQRISKIINDKKT